MGSKAGKIILPLVALGATALVTGPAGMGLWGSTAPAAGAGVTGAMGMGSDAASLAAAEAAAGIPGAAAITNTAIPGIFTMTSGTGLATGAGTLASSAAENAAFVDKLLAFNSSPAASGFTISRTAPGGFFSELSKAWNEASALEKASVGLSGIGAIGAIGTGMANAQAQENAIKLQEEQQRVRALSDNLTITQQEAAVQKRLQRQLASQAVYYNASGIDPTTGSALNQANSAYSNAQADLDTLATQRQIVNAGGAIDTASLANRRSQLASNAGIFAGSLLDFGTDALSTLRKSKYYQS